WYMMTPRRKTSAAAPMARSARHSSGEMNPGLVAWRVCRFSIMASIGAETLLACELGDIKAGRGVPPAGVPPAGAAQGIADREVIRAGHSAGAIKAPSPRSANEARPA